MTNEELFHRDQFLLSKEGTESLLEAATKRISDAGRCVKMDLPSYRGID